MKIRKFFIELLSNWPVKLLAAVAAVILYFLYQIVSLDSKSFSVPLELREDGNFALIDSLPQTVRVTVWANPEQIAAVQKTDIQAYIDTSSVTAAGVNSLPVKLELKDFFTLMEPLDIKIKPHTLSLSFEKKAYKMVPVKPLFSGTVADGFEVASQKVSPEYVKIGGPESIVESTTEVYTAAIDLQDRVADFKAPVTLNTESKKLRIFDVPDSFVKVVIKTQHITRSFSDAVPLVFNLDAALKPAQELPKIHIVLSGAKQILNAFTVNKLIIQADFTDIREAGVYTVPLRVHIPEDFSFVSINPPVLEVKLIEAEKEAPVSETQDDFISEHPVPQALPASSAHKNVL